ncbi:DUF3999 family protein [Formosa sp. PL04]|uniref:DUF3999 family protein n=1 Tax=Formosa sp. PL04 TaxID=3081755 RepID=UPI0029822810|nr:DUF3999 family protein [Formosa sp. PL04]MDW5288741.1 DUF3999 family protein [Formosa sp. PL04]
MKTWIKLLLMLSVVSAFGQDDTVTGKIDAVSTDGLRLIPIPHTVRSYATPNMRDLRIWDANGNQVPYFIQPETAYTHTTVSNFTAFAIISNTRIADSSATYIFKNPNATIKQAVLNIANYQGVKNYKLEGSHDKNKWFGIVNNGTLQDLNHPEETSVFKVIEFPICNYPYLKLVFDDRYSLPLNLLKIGEATAETVQLVPVIMEEIQVDSIAFSEADKTTQIHMSFKRQEIINQLKLDITSPDLYSRTATLYTLGEREVNRVKETYRQNITTFELRSDRPLVFNIPTTIAQEVYLEIENKDNPKLQITGIQIMQKPVYVVASLKAKQPYTITAGNTDLAAPDYDISEVTNTLKQALPIAEISTITYIAPENEAAVKTSLWQQPWFMWCCIGFAALIILYYGFNLIKDMNTDNK